MGNKDSQDSSERPELDTLELEPITFERSRGPEGSMQDMDDLRKESDKHLENLTERFSVTIYLALTVSWIAFMALAFWAIYGSINLLF
jgi:hypothetical protein